MDQYSRMAKAPQRTNFLSWAVLAAMAGMVALSFLNTTANVDVLAYSQF
jgi:hypothetical protein